MEERDVFAYVNLLKILLKWLEPLFLKDCAFRRVM